MLFGNFYCTVQKPGAVSVYGEPTLSAPKREQCMVVRLQDEVAHTTVRADQGATRGFADEEITENILLLTLGTIAQLGDIVTVDGVKIRLTSRFIRRDAMGRADHIEVRGEFAG